MFSQGKQLLVVASKWKSENISGKILPEDIKIVAEEKGELTTIDLSFRNLELDKSMTFPYKVPNGYDKITLK